MKEARRAWFAARRINELQSDELIRTAWDISSWFGTIADEWIWNSQGRWWESLRTVVQQMEPYLVDQVWLRDWPGSSAIDEHLRSKYRADQGLLDIVLGAGATLYDWCYPQLPDDPHLLRADGTVVLGSTPSEGALWVELLPEEEATIGRATLERWGLSRAE